MGRKAGLQLCGFEQVASPTGVTSSPRSSSRESVRLVAAAAVAFVRTLALKKNDSLTVAEKGGSGDKTAHACVNKLPF